MKRIQLTLTFIFLVPTLLIGRPLETFIGTLETDDPVVDALIESRCMQRLKGIEQCGMEYHMGHTPASFTRYEHCVGVYALLKRYGAPREEAIAGLLHDASHTAFSHLGDVLFDTPGYQDEIHDWYLEQTEAPSIIAAAKLSIEDIMPERPEFRALEQDLPDLCADRIEYNLHKALAFGLISQSELEAVLNDLHFEAGEWFFTSPESARKLGNISLHCTENLYERPKTLAMNTFAAQLLKHALDIGLISTEEIHFGEDAPILEKLRASEDPIIQNLLERCKNIENYFILASEADYEVHPRSKFRGVDPWVTQNGERKRLTAIDPEYQKEYERVRQKTQTGVYLKLL